MRTTSAYSRALSIQTAFLLPAARFPRPGFATLASLTPNEGGRSAESRSGAAAPVGRALGASQDARERAYDAARQALARRLASHNAGRSPLGAPPWRFFTRGRASVSVGARRPTTAGIRLRIRRASSSQPGRSAWRAGSRASRGERLQAACRGTPLPAPPSGCLRTTPLKERGCGSYDIDAIRSQAQNVVEGMIL